jgi:hypothetical protein
MMVARNSPEPPNGNGGSGDEGNAQGEISQPVSTPKRP